jgi:hypothetical protein
MGFASMRQTGKGFAFGEERFLKRLARGGIGARERRPVEMLANAAKPALALSTRTIGA